MLVPICRRPKEQTFVYAFVDKIYHQCKIADGTQPNAMERTRDRYRNRDAASGILLLSGAGASKDNISTDLHAEERPGHSLIFVEIRHREWSLYSSISTEYMVDGL